jgi:hypothetical protein
MQKIELVETSLWQWEDRFAYWGFSQTCYPVQSSARCSIKVSGLSDEQDDQIVKEFRKKSSCAGVERIVVSALNQTPIDASQEL